MDLYSLLSCHNEGYEATSRVLAGAIILIDDKHARMSRHLPLSSSDDTPAWPVYYYRLCMASILIPSDL